MTKKEVGEISDNECGIVVFNDMLQEDFTKIEMFIICLNHISVHQREQ